MRRSPRFINRAEQTRSSVVDAGGGIVVVVGEKDQTFETATEQLLNEFVFMGVAERMKSDLGLKFEVNVYKI